MTNQTLHTKFLTFLEKDVRIRDAAQRESLVMFAETKLADFIRRYLDMNYAGLYENTDSSYYSLMRRTVFSMASAKAENTAQAEQYTTALKHVAGFYASKLFKGKEKVRLSSAEKAKPYIVTEEARPSIVAEEIQAIPKTDMLQPSEDEPLTEGRIRQVSLTRHERNRDLRQACLRHYGYVCQVCGMDFEKAYGEIGKEFIEVHHLKPIAETDGEHVLDPETGLVPLCSNCHSMIHRGPDGQPFTIKQMQELYKGPKWQELSMK